MHHIAYRFKTSDWKIIQVGTRHEERITAPNSKGKCYMIDPSCLAHQISKIHRFSASPVRTFSAIPALPCMHSCEEYQRHLLCARTGQNKLRYEKFVRRLTSLHNPIKNRITV